MIVRSLKQVADMIGGELVGIVDENIYLQGVSIDSRDITKNNLFVPIVAERNGHDYVEKAIEQGAVISLWSQEEPNRPDVPLIIVKDTLLALQQLASVYRDELQLKVVGITGSNGKTTTKDMIASILETTYRAQKTKGNLNNHIGVPLTILSLREDTEVAVIEMGMNHFGEIELLSKLAKPDIAVITNIGESHLAHLGSRAGIAKAKLEIVEGLHADGVLIYYGDEPLLRSTNQNLITFGSNKENDWFATDVKMTVEGTSFFIKNNEEIFIPILGKHHVQNALASIAIATYLNVSIANIKKGLSQLEMTKMRMQVIHAKNNITIINDAYNASPTSMKAALATVGELDYEKKIVVLGDMLELGDDEVYFHEEIGKMLKPNIADYVFTYGERSKYIATKATSAFPEGHVKLFIDKQTLINELKHVVVSNTLLLIKASMGMKLWEVITPFEMETKENR